MMITAFRGKGGRDCFENGMAWRLGIGLQRDGEERRTCRSPVLGMSRLKHRLTVSKTVDSNNRGNIESFAPTACAVVRAVNMGLVACVL